MIGVHVKSLESQGVKSTLVDFFLKTLGLSSPAWYLICVGTKRIIPQEETTKMSKLSDTISRITGALAVLPHAISPKDVAWAIRRSITKMGGVGNRLNAETLILKEREKDIVEKYKRAAFNNIEDYNHAISELKEQIILQLTDFLSKVTALEGDVNETSDNVREPKDFKLTLENGEVSMLTILKTLFSKDGLGGSVLSGDNTLAEGIVGTFTSLGHNDFTAEHESYGAIARAANRVVRKRFMAPKAPKNEAKPDTSGPKATGTRAERRAAKKAADAKVATE